MKDEKPKICRREINENIRRIYAGEELTRSLKALNCDCEFRKEYDNFCLVQEGKPIDKIIKNREWGRKCRQKPEVKARIREYFKEYRQKPEVKARIREYHKKYYQKPEVKARKREFMREKYRKINHIPKSRWRVK